MSLSQKNDAISMVAIACASITIITTMAFLTFFSNNELVGLCLESGKYSFEECLTLK